MPQIEKPDDLQSIANHPVFLRIRDKCLLWFKVAEFGKNTVVYGQIAGNGHDVRKWADRKLAITDKMVKNGRLSVKIQPFRTRFYGQMLQKAGFVRKSSS